MDASRTVTRRGRRTSVASRPPLADWDIIRSKASAASRSSLAASAAAAAAAAAALLLLSSEV
jgi:hypothetical protein